MHWPIAFKPGGERFPRGEDGKPILDKETTVAEVLAFKMNHLM
jgi:hypothetical protein